jgi:hypothetical protein
MARQRLGRPRSRLQTQHATIGSMGNNVDRFLDEVRTNCFVVWSPRTELTDGEVGRFLEPNRLEVANVPNWQEILAHEYGHFLQRQEGLFLEYDGDAARYSETARRTVTECELDAEKRAWRILRRFGLLKDPTQYRQRANEYAQSRRFLGVYGRSRLPRPDWADHSHHFFPGHRWMAVDEALSPLQIQVLMEVWHT